MEINYTPPSHVLKIVDDARDYSESDWSEDEPIYVLKDGQRGTFIRKDDKYYLAKTVKERSQKRKHKLNEKKSKKIENGNGEELIKKIHYINYEADEESEEEDQKDVDEEHKQENDEGEKQQSKQPTPTVYSSTPNLKSPSYSSHNITTYSTTETESDSESESEAEIEYDSEGLVIEKPPKPPKPPKHKSKKAAVYINYRSSEDETKQKKPQQEIHEEEPEEEEERIEDQIVLMDDDDMDSDQTDEEDKAKLVASEEEEEELSNLRPETVMDDKYFDAKKVQDSDSDLDEFGRLKDRQRPSSATFDFLPPLKPDPRLDGGDITNCKNRLSRHVVIIREALARNERK